MDLKIKLQENVTLYSVDFLNLYSSLSIYSLIIKDWGSREQPELGGKKEAWLKSF